MRNCSFLIVLLLFSAKILGQQKSDFKPYSIESTYQKLKKEYPFIKPIPTIKMNQIEAFEDIVYKRTETSNLRLDVYIPKTESNERLYPAIIMIHGGGWLTGSKDIFRPMAKSVSLKNFVGITISYRLGFEKPYPAAIQDIKDAVRWVRDNSEAYNIDSEKIAILGGSSGGHLATLVGMTPNSPIYGSNNKVSDEVDAVVNIDGIVSFIHPEASAEGKMASIWLDGTKTENYKNWSEASTLQYVDENSPPILFINSSQKRFHAGRDAMIKILDSCNIINMTYTIQNSPHSFWLVNPWYEETIDKVTNFLINVFKTN